MASTPPWARHRAHELAGEHGHVRSVECGAIDAFAAYIASKEEPPVDPLLIEAREIVCELNRALGYSDRQLEAIRTGNFCAAEVTAAISGIRRGVEIAQRELAKQEQSDVTG